MCSYAEFVETYNDWNLTGHDVRRILNLNSNKYRKLRKQAICNGDIPETRHMNKTGAKFYTCTSNNTFLVKKQTGGVCKVFGEFTDEDDAKYIVKLCLNNGWDENDFIRSEINRLKVKPKNYSIVNGYYTVQKVVDGRNTVFLRVRVGNVSEDVIQSIVERFNCDGWNETTKSKVIEEFNIN